MLIRKKVLFIFLLFSFCISNAQTPLGYDLWLGYSSIKDDAVLKNYKELCSSIYIDQSSDVLISAQQELENGLSKMLDQKVSFEKNIDNKNSLIIATKDQLNDDVLKVLSPDLFDLKKNAYLIKSIVTNNKNQMIITAEDDLGILYGVFKLLQILQARQNISNLEVSDAPGIDLRILNHWDNLDRTVERGYAGFSLWNWQKLPEYIDQRYIDYARANASIGINGTVLTNVNANALVLTPMYLEKVAALANVFRKYGIRVYLTARFSAPIEIGGLPTADPLNQEVQNWWNEKVQEIYNYIPDFGGFLVKANSEGQPGPQNYNRSHADGANMLATALEPFNGIVMWRAFVYSEHDPMDRAKQAYSEFVPYDGKFMDNVLIQVKNGPIDFQPREPFHPMFGAMPKTSLMMEFQITQEYLGFSTHLVFLPKLFEEVLQSDTHVKGKQSTVSKIIDGTLHGNKTSGIAGVSNIGNDLNWTGHPFAQANWYGFGRLAWNPNLSAKQIAEDWLKLTYSNDPHFLKLVTPMMINSREAVVNYMNPLGLHHIFDTGHHYGPGPWVRNLSRPEWNPTYYHKADENGIGFDRTIKGSNAIAQYNEGFQKLIDNPKTCPEKYLLWFHHLPWDFKLNDGQILWDKIALQYQKGVEEVESMIATWEKAKQYISKEEYQETKMLLDIQLKEARWWRDACLLYFQTFSKMELPDGVEPAEHTLEYYQSLKFPFAPGIRPRWD